MTDNPFHHSHAPAEVRERIRIASQETGFARPDDSVHAIAAIGWIAAVRCAGRYGFLILASEIPTPLHDELARLEHDAPTLMGRFRSMNSIGLQYERQAKTAAANSEIAIPLQRARAKAELAEREEAHRRATIDARAAKILADAESSRAEKARVAARKQAERELGEGTSNV